LKKKTGKKKFRMKNNNFIPYYKVLDIASKKVNKNKKSIKIYTLSNFNFLTLNTYLDFFLEKRNLNTKIRNGAFDQIDQEIIKINKNADLKNANIIIIAIDIYSALFGKFDNLSFFLKELLKKLSAWIKVLNKNSSPEIIFWNCPLQEINFYNLKNKNYNEDKIIYNFNNKLYQFSKNFKNFHIFDFFKISAYFGFENLYNLKNNFISKIPYSEKSQCQISSDLARLISSILIPNKKCLVLDLDNTLWGGIIGEDGIEGIELGDGYEGEKFTRFQKYIQNLKKRGILLAVNSKNNFEDVKKCFKQNPEMILKLSDFINIKVNWENKYINIKKIAEEINIGLDSIVFFDDSKYEREQMKNFCPEVNTVSVPKDPDFFISSIENSGYFDIRKLTKEDKNKNYKYNILKKAQKLKLRSKNFEKFLKDLSMIIEVSNINKYNFERCVQMTNKTNKFNLITERYTSQKLNNFIKSNEQISVVVRVKDKFGDHGITGLAMAKKKSNKLWTINTFLLSCRILGRNIEKVVLIELLKKLKLKKATVVKGEYIKTSKNQICKNFYQENNFIKKNKSLQIDLKKCNLKTPLYFNVKQV